MNLLRTLATAFTHYRGEGINHENERFVAELRIERLPSDHAVMLHYRASLEDHSVAH